MKRRLAFTMLALALTTTMAPPPTEAGRLAAGIARAARFPGRLIRHHRAAPEAAGQATATPTKPAPPAGQAAPQCTARGCR
jgi:hypothetical protein